MFLSPVPAAYSRSPVSVRGPGHEEHTSLDLGGGIKAPVAYMAYAYDVYLEGSGVA